MKAVEYLLQARSTKLRQMHLFLVLVVTGNTSSHQRQPGSLRGPFETAGVSRHPIGKIFAAMGCCLLKTNTSEKPVSRKSLKPSLALVP